MPAHLLTPEETDYDNRVRNVSIRRRIELENLSTSFDLATLCPFERGIVEAYRKTPQYTSGVIRSEKGVDHHPV